MCFAGRRIDMQPRDRHFGHRAVEFYLSQTRAAFTVAWLVRQSGWPTLGRRPVPCTIDQKIIYLIAGL
jgi:hypothetical protein